MALNFDLKMPSCQNVTHPYVRPKKYGGFEGILDTDENSV
jgi:hypothetical protein